MDASQPLTLLDWRKSTRGSGILLTWVVIFWGVSGYSVKNWCPSQKSKQDKVDTKHATTKTKGESQQQQAKGACSSDHSTGNDRSSISNAPESSTLDPFSSTSALRRVITTVSLDPSVRVRGALLSVAICLRLFVSIKISQHIGQLGSLLAQRKWKMLAQAQMRYALWTMPAALVNALVDFASKYFSVAIRSRLVGIMHHGLGESRILETVAKDVPEADQRMTTDVENLSEELSMMLQSVFKPAAESVILSFTLAKMMGTQQLLMCYAYFGLAATWSRSCTPSLTSMSSQVSKEEGEFRSAHSRLKEYTEEVQFARGEKTETIFLDKRFASLNASTVKFAMQKFMSASLDGYVVRYMGILVALGMMTPALSKRSCQDEIENPTEFFLTCLHLLVNLMSAFKDVAVAFRTLDTLKGTSRRLSDLLEIMNVPLPNQGKKSGVAGSVHATAIEQKEKNDKTAGLVVLETVEITTPQRAAERQDQQQQLLSPSPRRVLFSNLNLTFSAGESVFISGPNGVGKSSLFRVIANIWTPTTGKVHCDRRECMFLTQRPYLVPGLTLREQILYPDCVDVDCSTFNETDDEQILNALDKVGLTAGPRVRATLDSPAWRVEGLSSGEQQRLACARLLVRTPCFCFADEALSSCTESFEKYFIKHCIETLGITMVTISHRTVAKSLHHRIIDLAPDGTFLVDTVM